MNTLEMNDLVIAERNDIYKKYITTSEAELPEVKVKYNLIEE
jgi:hypothetical protein